MSAALAPALARRRRATPARLVGGGVAALLILGALLGPEALGLDPAAQPLARTLEEPSAEHPLGTDHLGRDMAARLLAVARLALALAALSVASAVMPGAALGILAAWAGGWIDRALGALAAAVLAVPGLPLVLLLAAIAPGSWWALDVGLSLTLWVEHFRFSRATARAHLASPAVEASRLLGFGRLYALRRHLLPEILPGLLTLAAFGAATAVTAVAALGFVGVGLRPPTAEWGVMMTERLPYWREAPWLMLQPILCLALTAGAFQLLAGGGRP